MCFRTRSRSSVRASSICTLDGGRRLRRDPFCSSWCSWPLSGRAWQWSCPFPFCASRGRTALFEQLRWAGQPALAGESSSRSGSGLFGEIEVEIESLEYLFLDNTTYIKLRVNKNSRYFDTYLCFAFVFSEKKWAINLTFYPKGLRRILTLNISKIGDLLLLESLSQRAHVSSSHLGAHSGSKELIDRHRYKLRSVRG